MAIKDIVIDLSKYSDDDYQLENLENYTYAEDNSVPTIESLIPCGSVAVQAAYGAPQNPVSCGPTKYPGDTINLAASPGGGTHPYTVRFWRKAGGTGGTYSQAGATQSSVAENATVTGSILLNGFDVSGATGDTTAGAPTSDDTGIIIDPFGGGAPLAISKIRVATTVADSCPIVPKICVSYCDVTLGCHVPTCNFAVL
jgi:hypothetical protein